MARPTTKEDLLLESQKGYDRLITLINNIDENHLNDFFTFDISKEKQAHWSRDENIKDVIVHLLEWQNLLLEWIDSNMNNIERQFLREGYNWRTYGDMNVEIKEEHANTTLTEALSSLEKTHYQLISKIKSFSNDELFSKNIFKWVGGSTLGSYFVSSTSSHYDWAYKKINKFKKAL